MIQFLKTGCGQIPHGSIGLIRRPPKPYVHGLSVGEDTPHLLYLPLLLPGVGPIDADGVHPNGKRPKLLPQMPQSNEVILGDGNGFGFPAAKDRKGFAMGIHAAHIRERRETWIFLQVHHAQSAVDFAWLLA